MPNKKLVVRGEDHQYVPFRAIDNGDGTFSLAMGGGGSGGAVKTDAVRATISVVTAVASSVTSVQLVAANAARLGFNIYNDSNASLYLKFGSGAASLTDFSVLIQAGALYEIPDRSAQLEMRVIWATANGFARVTEVS